jgi:hypothetical protein
MVGQRRRATGEDWTQCPGIGCAATGSSLAFLDTTYLTSPVV